MKLRLAASTALAVLVCGAFASAHADDSILYYVDAGRVVFTNTASRKDVAPVPGLEKLKVEFRSSIPGTVYDPFIRKVAADEGLDPSLIKAVALVESGFNPRAVSPKGARGLMQLMPATARQYGVKDPHDPYQNLRAGASHLRSLLGEFKGDLTLALAAYNAGSGAVRRYGGVPRYRETQEYVRKVQSRMGAEPPRPVALPAKTSGPSVEGLTIDRAADGSMRARN